MKDQIQLINHSSVLISNNDIKILTDPWYSGSAFNDGWSLLHEKDLIDLDKFLNIDDTNLYNFYNGFETDFEIEKNNISLLFKNFKY